MRNKVVMTFLMWSSESRMACAGAHFSGEWAVLRHQQAAHHYEGGQLVRSQTWSTSSSKSYKRIFLALQRMSLGSFHEPPLLTCRRFGFETSATMVSKLFPIFSVELYVFTICRIDVASMTGP